MLGMVAILPFSMPPEDFLSLAREKNRTSNLQPTFLVEHPTQFVELWILINNVHLQNDVEDII
jgi:hypothetical protein